MSRHGWMPEMPRVDRHPVSYGWGQAGAMTDQI